MIIRYVYIVFIGILLATFIGVGIAAFYPSPTYPEPPLSIKYARPLETSPKESTQSAQQIKEQEDYDKKSRVFEEERKNYSRNVSIIALVAAIIILALSLILTNKILLIADGFLLGSTLTLIYSIIRGFESGDSKFRFIVVSIGLAISLFLGYLRFLKTEKIK